MEEKIKRFSATEVELEYLLTGEENESTLIFAHGAGANIRQFLNQHQYFSKNYRVLSFSMRGHGNSKLPKEKNSGAFAMQKHAKDAIELFEFLGINRFHFIGCSAGGMLGYELMSQKPEYFLTIATFGTAPEIKYPKPIVNLIAGIDRMMLKISYKGYSTFMSNAVTKNVHARKQIIDLFMHCHKDTIWCIRKNLGNYSYLYVMEKVRVPALIINGEWDKGIANCLKAASKTIEENPYYSVVDLKDAGHVANLDQPMEFNKIIERHISKAAVSN